MDKKLKKALKEAHERVRWFPEWKREGLDGYLNFSPHHDKFPVNSGDLVKVEYLMQVVQCKDFHHDNDVAETRLTPDSIFLIVDFIPDDHDENEIYIKILSSNNKLIEMYMSPRRFFKNFRKISQD